MDEAIMKYWRVNTDRNARDDVRTCDLWYRFGMLFTGDFWGQMAEHNSVLRKIQSGDGVFMHHSNAGIVGYGLAKEEWDGNTIVGMKRRLYVKETYEYRMAIAWQPQYDRRDDPLPISGRLPYMGTFSEVDPGKWDVTSVLQALRRHDSSEPAAKLSEGRSFRDDIAREALFEGAERTVVARVYERSPAAREHCIAEFGDKCCICGFDFEVYYGRAGAGYIEVHHLFPMAEFREKHIVDPVRDLRPVCANCHAMIHRRSPAYSIDEVARMIRAQQDASQDGRTAGATSPSVS